VKEVWVKYSPPTTCHLSLATCHFPMAQFLPYLFKISFMKTSRSNNNMQSSSGNTKKPRPEIRDNMDSHKSKQGRIKKEALKKQPSKKK
jgi:hypothetical protein